MIMFIEEKAIASKFPPNLFLSVEENINIGSYYHGKRNRGGILLSRGHSKIGDHMPSVGITGSLNRIHPIMHFLYCIRVLSVTKTKKINL